MTQLNFLIPRHVSALVWSLDHLGMRTLGHHRFLAISYRSRFVLTSPNVHDSVGYPFLDPVGLIAPLLMNEEVNLFTSGWSLLLLHWA